MAANPARLTAFRLGLITCMSLLLLCVLLANGYDKSLGLESLHDSIGRLGWLALFLSVPCTGVVLIKEKGWWRFPAIIMIVVYLLIGLAYWIAQGIGQLQF